MAIAMSVAALAAPLSPGATGPHHRGSSHRAPSHSAPASRGPAVHAGPRDERGRIVRSEAAKAAFMRQTGYPHGRPGYVVDHVVPLAKGGADAPGNMQWQTVAEARAKDKWERK
jgi:hypothetical protein